MLLVNGAPSSAMGVRARSLAALIGRNYSLDIYYRQRGKVVSIARFLAALAWSRPTLVYVVDMAYSGVAAALLYKQISGCRVVIDTGDAISALARAIGRNRVGYMLTRALEEVSLRSADGLVVRGSNHRTMLGERGLQRVTFIPDGVDLEQFRPLDASAVRARLGLGDDLVIGTLGTSAWNERLQTCYGWDMIEALHLLRGYRVKAVMIGGGTGIPHLKERARGYGLEDRVVFLDYVPYDELPLYLNAFDIGLSKQTNDAVGHVRTTGKLPLYLACGLYVLATRVGEAAHVLPEEMLLDYDGQRDPTFPTRLAARVEHVLTYPSLLEQRARSVAIARSHFDYHMLVQRLEEALDDVLPYTPLAPREATSSGAFASRSSR